MIRPKTDDKYPSWLLSVTRPAYEDDSGIIHISETIPDVLDIYGYFRLINSKGEIKRFQYKMTKFAWNMYEMVKPPLKDMAAVERICADWVNDEFMACMWRDQIYKFIDLVVNRHYMEIEDGADNTLQSTNLSYIITYR